ncbi:hypothetical protein RI129_008077 [Pyrocoelia pectoralis]|uniref:Diuretic hormone receptor n=1 Tax=Pyrocoelia pectoralis TaxID=417401 RepID=A0AAN7VAU9_9COLE
MSDFNENNFNLYDDQFLLEHLNETETELTCELRKKLEQITNGCGTDFDRVLCWPQTSPNTLAVLPCLSQLNGIRYDTTQNASRWCFPNGTWDQYTDYSRCKELYLDNHAPGVEIATTIYFVGYSISLIALTIAVFIFWKFKDLKCLRNTIHMNLMCTYILADFMWTLTYTLQMSLQTNKGLCILLTILLHYFHLTNFFWMFVEGLYLHILVVKTFTGDNIKLPIYTIIGWGCPMVFVLIWGITRSFSPTENDRKAGEIIRSCPWTPHVSDWIYQVPAMAVLLSNVVFMCVIMWVLITKLRSANSAETQQYRKAAKALLVLIPLLGITYILVIVGPAEDGLFKSIYDVVRAILLSTQGFTVALFYCFLNTEVKNTVRHRFNSWHARRTVGSQRESRYSGRDWSQRSNRSRGESLRLYNQSGKMYRKRESTCSDATTTTVITVATTGKQTPQVRSPLLPPGEFD